jgi:hypothetical protein
MSFGFNRKSGNDLPKSPELLPLKEKNFPHSFLLISIRNTALKREQSETRVQEGSQYQTFRGWKIISQPIRGRQGFGVSLRHEHPTEFIPKAQAEGKTNIHAGVLKG